ncbi:MAG: ATP-binding protein [Dehalococcoidia bacterium]
MTSTPSDKKNILVVDDDLGFLEVIKRILQAKGYAVDTAASGGEAIAGNGDRPYDVAILDISLPDMGGTELLPAVIELHPDIIAIMLTGRSSVDNAIQSLNLGAFAFLEKPLDPDQLLSVIDRGMEKQGLVLENRKLLGELEQHGREMSILLAVSRAISQSMDLQRIIDLVLQKVAEAMDVAACSVHLRSDGHLALEGSYGFTPELVAKISLSGVDQGVMGRILGQARPVVVEELAGGAEPTLAPLAEGGYRSYAGVPLIAGGESIGVLGVATSSERCFNAREVELLTEIGREISIAVHNAHLYEEASSARALRELDTMRTEFLANISHELRTPLAAIKGFASSLLQPDVEFDEATRHDFLQTIDREADGLNRLIEELLLMSRLEAGALEVTREWTKVTVVLEMIKDRLLSLTSGHRLTTIIPPDLSRFSVDAGHIGEVFTNLVGNAAKYSPEGTLITIEARQDGEQAIISVTDEGPGIPPDLREKIFERFYQMENNSVGRRRGTGLGLAICRGIVEAHGGKIWVESNPGGGARFSFSLPTN